MVAGLILAYVIIDWHVTSQYGEVGAFFILFVSFYIFRKRVIKQQPTPTPALAIVMSAGVFVSDFFHIMPFKNDSVIHFIQLLVICIFMLWLFFIYSYTKAIFTGTFYLQHVSGILNSFGMGTWIAGASVCSMGIIMYLPKWMGIAYIIVTVNSLVWIMLVGLYIRNSIKLFKDRHLLLNGIVLLSTVSTMSVAIDYSLVLNIHTFWLILFLLIMIGALFYIGFISLIIRSLLIEKWTIVNDFRNTNCIFHGALSITGLAGIMTGVFSHLVSWGLWFIVVFIFVVVESMEVLRAVMRLKHFGYKKALGTYHVSQWARNFTFSMLLAFTFKLPMESITGIGQVLLKDFSTLLFVVVLFLLLYESFLFMKDQTYLFERKINKDHGKTGMTLPH